MIKLARLYSLAFGLALSFLLMSGATAITLSGENKGVLPLNGTPYPISNLTVANSYVTFHLDASTRFSMNSSVLYYNDKVSLYIYKGTPENCTLIGDSDGTGYHFVNDRKVNTLKPLYLAKGDYTVMMYPNADSSKASSCILTASTSLLPSDDMGENNTADSAAAIAFPGSADGVVNSGGDVDCYKFTLAQAGPVELNVRNKFGENTMRMKVLSGGTTVYSAEMASAPNQLHVRRLYLDAGSHVVSLDGQYKYPGFAYNLSVRSGDPIESAWMPTSATLSEGVPNRLYIAMSDTYLNCAQFVWTSDKPSVATVDNSGVVTGVSLGTATITAASADGRYTFQCRVTIKDNVFTRSKPYVGKQKGLYSSAKKMYYKGNTLYVEVYVYNKMGRTTPKLYGLIALVYYFKGYAYGNVNMPIWGCAAYEEVDVPSMRRNSYKVIKFSRNMAGKTRMDLRSKQFDALVCDDETFYEVFDNEVSWKGLPSKQATRKSPSWILYKASIKEGT